MYYINQSPTLHVEAIQLYANYLQYKHPLGL